MLLYIVLSIVLVALNGSSFALQCYKCEGCEVPFDPARATIETCQIGSQKCVAFQDFTGRVTRGCGFWLRYGLRSTNYCQTIVTAESTATSCALFCDDDLCNDQSPADAVDDTLNCYECIDNGSGATTECSPTGFNPNAVGMSTLTCDGSCMIESRPNRGRIMLERTCLPAFYGECEPGCNEFGHCVECCNTNLCNSPSK